MLASLYLQLSNYIEVTLVDYGSALDYQQELALLLKDLPKVRLILCPAQGQLFHKTRAINIVVKNTTSTYFMVLDMDCICHPEFIDKALELVALGHPVNFPYGFLSEQESKLNKSFDNYNYDFVGGLTGTAIFKTTDLLELNGFDEIYHNWGAEDADMFERLKLMGITTTHYTDELLLLHQWHKKEYRNTGSKLPYHPALEKINHEYFQFSLKLKRTKANQSSQWGLGFDPYEYKALSDPTSFLTVNATQEELTALFLQMSEINNGEILQVKVQKFSRARVIKGRLKSLLGKKQPRPVSLEKANHQIIEHILFFHRNKPYRYFFDADNEIIVLVCNMTNKNE